MEKEISLREIIEVVWSGKWIILLIVLIALLTSGIISFFVISPTYEARVTLMVSSNNTDGNGVSLPKYTEQVKNHAVMRATIQDLQLDKAGVTINSLRNRIRTETIKETNLIRVHVKDSDPDQASQIANAVTKHFIIYIKNQELEHLITTSEYQLSQIDSDINIQREILEKVNQELVNTPKYIELKKSLSQEPFLNSVISDQTGKSSSQTGVLQYVEEDINPAYAVIEQLITNTHLNIQMLESTKNELQKKIDQNSFIVNEYVLVASPAIPPEYPIAPNKKVIVGASGLASIMLGLFVVFFRHYWRLDSLRKNEQSSLVSA